MAFAFGTEPGFGRRAVWAGALAIALCAALYEVRTYDTLFHLAAGRFMLEHGALPDRDPFSFSFRGAPWQNHSRGFQLLLAALYALGGFAAISVYQALLALLLMAAALWGFRRRPLSELALAAGLAGLPFAAFREVLEARPHVLGFAACALLLSLARWAVSNAAALCFAVPLYAVWASSHGSHLLAYPVLGVGALVSAWQRRFRLSASFAACAAGCAGMLAWLAPAAVTQGLAHATSSFLESSIPEWRPLSLRDLFGSAAGLCFAGLWLASIAGAGMRWWDARRSQLRPLLAAALGEPVMRAASQPPEAARAPLPDPLEPYSRLWLAGALVLALSSRRMIGLYLFGAAPLWLPYATYALRRVCAGRRFSLAARAWCALAFGAALLAIYLQRDTFHTGWGLARERFPSQVVQAIRSDARVRRLYNAYNYGGYLMFAGVPADGVFIDGRALTLYPFEFLTEFHAAYTDPRRFERLAARYACDAVLLPRDSSVAAALRAHLHASSHWRLTHHDQVAELYERAGEHPPTLAR